MPPVRSRPTRPLVVTEDPALLDDLLRLAATAGVELVVAADAGAARSWWSSAACVLVGADRAADCARARLPRRADVTLVATDLDDAGVWQTAVEVGADGWSCCRTARTALATRLADAVEGAGRDAVLVAVLGGRGGAGATTLACALAVTAARTGRSVLLVDGDPLGGGLDLVFGGESRARAALARPRGDPRTGAGGRARRGSAPDGRVVGAVLGPGHRRGPVGRGRVGGARAPGGGRTTSWWSTCRADRRRRRPRRARQRRTACCWSSRPRCGAPRRPAGWPRPSGCSAPTCGSWSAGSRTIRLPAAAVARCARAAAGRHAAARAGPRRRARAGRATGPARPGTAGRPVCPAPGGAAAARRGRHEEHRPGPAGARAPAGRRQRATADRRGRRGGPARRGRRAARRRRVRAPCSPRCSSEIVGAGPLEPLLRDPAVTDVLVNAPDEVWVDRGEGLRAGTGGRFADDAAVRRLAQRLAAPTGRRLDDAQPWVDARLDGGVRLHAVLPPVAPRRHLPVPARPAPPGVHPRRARGAAGALPPDGVRPARPAGRPPGRPSSSPAVPAPARRPCCRRCCRWSTRRDRLLLVEDAGELAPAHPHVVRLEARPPNLEGAGAVIAARPGPPGPADAPRPARGGRGARGGGRRPARRAQHRARGRLRHAARQLRRRRPRPARGAGEPSPGSAERRCTASWRPGCASSSTWSRPAGRRLPPGRRSWLSCGGSARRWSTAQPGLDLGRRPRRRARPGRQQAASAALLRPPG